MGYKLWFMQISFKISDLFCCVGQKKYSEERIWDAKVWASGSCGTKDVPYSSASDFKESFNYGDMIHADELLYMALSGGSNVNNWLWICGFYLVQVEASLICIILGKHVHCLCLAGLTCHHDTNVVIHQEIISVLLIIFTFNTIFFSYFTNCI